MNSPVNELVAVWIEDLEKQPSSTLYKTLIPHYKPVYNASDRFVFYNFATVHTSTLDHVADILQYIDISHWFVTVITNQPAVQEYFESLPEPIRVVWQDQGPEHTVVDQATPLFNTQNQMCVHAWSGLHVQPDGSTQLCCRFAGRLHDDTGKEFNIRQHNIKEIVNSQHVKSLREQFRQGAVPKECNGCVATEKLGGVSKRQFTRFKLQNVWGYVDWESDSDSNLGFVGGHLGNLCNLKCRICDERFSSSIAAEKLSTSANKYKENPTRLTLLNNNWKHHSQLFYDHIKQIPQLRNFEFLGGEPLLVKENLEFMQYLVDHNLSQDCIFEFVTNGTQYPDVFDCADRFKKLLITLSIDDIEDRFEYQRYGAKWPLVTSNLKRFMSNPHLQIGVVVTVNIQNVFYLPELVTWLLAQGVDNYDFNILYEPVWANIKQLTPQAKQLVINKLTNSGLPAEHQSRLNYILSTIQKSSDHNDGQDFVKNIQLVDQVRNQNFALAHPEIAQAMGFN